MRKNKLLKAVVAVYIVVTLMVAALALAIPKQAFGIIVCYLTIFILSAVCVAIGFYFTAKNKEKTVYENLSQILNNINTMVILWDTDFRYVRVNDEFTKVLGFTSEDLDKNKSAIEKILPKDAFSPTLASIVNNRDEEFMCTAKDGGTVCTVWNTSLMHVSNSQNRTSYIMMSIGTNLTETMKMKEELIKYTQELTASENKYSLSMELSEIGLLLKEIDSNKIYISDQLVQMLGFESNYITADDIRSIIHPKDIPVYDSLIKIVISNSTIDVNIIHTLEFRMRSKDTLYHWYEFRYKITPNPDVNLARIGGSIIDITKDKEKDKLIERMAYIDDVTQIFNRNKFMQIGQETFTTSSALKFSYWVVVLDIDNFHIINDTCGYLNGNKLLSEFADMINDLTKESGFAARIGGDNFAIIIRDNGDDEHPIEVIQNIQRKLPEISKSSLQTQTLTCSAGYCKMSDGGSDFAKVLDHAEFALSLSDGTRGNIIRYDRTIHEKFIEGAAIENELALAIENNELILYYQPKINLTDGTLVGMEALIRWVKPDGTIVPPNQFIPVAERSFLITKISAFVLKEACRQNKAWQDMGYEPLTVSINLTAVDFYQTDVKETIQRALDMTGLKPQWLDVELTESLALKDIDNAVAQMEEIKELGVKLSMDDFGTGYSSLSYIQILPISLLKLDRSFVMYLEEDEISREIVSAVIRIAKSKKIETIAEGIETLGQAEILRKTGCDYAQGYYFGKPMPAEKFEEFMANKQDITILL